MVPGQPGGLVLTVARRKSIDMARGRRRDELASEQLKTLAAGLHAAAELDPIPDRRLALMFACAHPSIEEAIRAPLMLQVALGLDASSVASAFLTSPAAMGKRLVRAKDKIRQAGIPFRIPGRDELPARLDAVLDAVYAAFTEGWTDARGADAARRDLTEEAMFLASLVVELLPKEPEAMGLLALMLYTEARRRARRQEDGEYVPLRQQDPSLWDSRMIAEAEALLIQASALHTIGRYQLEGALQSAHVEHCRSGRSNGTEVLQLYDALLAIVRSPVIAINRAVALAEVEGPEAALDALQAVAGDARLAEYQPYWAARAELLSRTGRNEEARSAYEMAVGLARDPAVRNFLLKQMGELTIDS